ncbi:MAG: LapA family protein [Nitrospirales bacterium]
MYSALITFLLILFLAVAFSLQNSEPIKIDFFSWAIEASRAVVLLTALACGVILGVFACLPAVFKKSRSLAQQHKTITQLEQTVAEQSRMLAQQHNTITQLEQTVTEQKRLPVKSDLA